MHRKYLAAHPVEVESCNCVLNVVLFDRLSNLCLKYVWNMFEMFESLLLSSGIIRNHPPIPTEEPYDYIKYIFTFPGHDSCVL